MMRTQTQPAQSAGENDDLRRRLHRVELLFDRLAAKVAQCEIALGRAAADGVEPGQGPLARMFYDAITELRIGRTIGPYRVLRRIGIGGMGTVYCAEDTRLGRHVALKFVAATAGHDDRPLRRFNREARAASSVSHPNICTIHEVGDDEGIPFMVMELLNGESLRQRLVSGPMSLPQVLEVAIPIADALDLVHQRGFIHRDLTPANIFITDRGVPKLLDFGLATVVRPPSGDSTADPDPDALDVTAPKTIVGTPGYMSPEQTLGLPLDPRSDLFSLGAVVYEMATGLPAFDGKGTRERLERVLMQGLEPMRPINVWQSPGLGAVITKALRIDPDYRYQSAREFVGDLEQLQANLPKDCNWAPRGFLNHRSPDFSSALTASAAMPA